jgi:ABC-type Fe3+-siderophore transport system permease subunit
VVVRYVDLVGIFDPHCLNFLFNISGRFLVTVTVEIGIILLELLIITVRTFFSISLVGFWPPLQLRWVSFC